jgi:signal recognition particle subunit SRP54
MFEGLTNRLNKIFIELRRRGKLSAEDLEATLKEVRNAMLEADVNFQVVKEFIENAKKRMTGMEVSQSLNPAQQIIKIVYEEFIEILGKPETIKLRGEKPRLVFLVGLQGSGKTTTTVKVARLLRDQGERVLLVAADPYRPAAVQQLLIMADNLKLPVFTTKSRTTVNMVSEAYQSARNGGYSVLIIDTAGRSQIDERLMSELKEIHDKFPPGEVLLVVDAMTGQEAVKIAHGFNTIIPISGLIMTKMDGDARGGAALSIRKVTGIPIKIITTGESIDAIEQFNPRRLTDRILGMGDIMGLIEKAEKTFDQQQLVDQSEKLKKGKITLEEYADQLGQIRKMGSMGQLLDMLPGSFSAQNIATDQAERKILNTLAVIQSMTVKERRDPEILNANRRKRIAAGSGTSVQAVNRVIKEFYNMQTMLKKFGKLDGKGLSTLLHK